MCRGCRTERDIKALHMSRGCTTVRDITPFRNEDYGVHGMGTNMTAICIILMGPFPKPYARQERMICTTKGGKTKSIHNKHEEGEIDEYKGSFKISNKNKSMYVAGEGIESRKYPTYIQFSEVAKIHYKIEVQRIPWLGEWIEIVDLEL